MENEATGFDQAELQSTAEECDLGDVVCSLVTDWLVGMFQKLLIFISGFLHTPVCNLHRMVWQTENI